MTAYGLAFFREQNEIETEGKVCNISYNMDNKTSNK